MKLLHSWVLFFVHYHEWPFLCLFLLLIYECKEQCLHVQQKSVPLICLLEMLACLVTASVSKCKGTSSESLLQSIWMRVFILLLPQWAILRMFRRWLIRVLWNTKTTLAKHMMHVSGTLLALFVHLLENTLTEETKTLTGTLEQLGYTLISSRCLLYI